MWKNLKRWKEQRIGNIEPSLNTKLVWLLISLFAIADTVGLKIEGIKLAAHDFLTNIATIIILLILTVIYTYFRRSDRIAGMTHMGAVFLSFAAVTAVFSYLITAWHRPLVDEYLAAADRTLGFDWLASYKWVIAHPWAYKGLSVIYGSLIPQVVFLLIFLNFYGRCARSWEMLWLFMVSCMGCILFSGLWPAVGAFGYYHVETDRAYVRAFMSLYNGTLKVIGDSRVEGIIQFPSYHIALAILLTYAARGMPILFLTFVEINILLFISTPVIGGHHFADIWGGIVLALLSILVVRKAFAAGLIPDTEKISSM